MRHILTLRLAQCLLLSGLVALSSFANTATLVYNPAGNVATRTTTLGTTTYTYDQLNRLTAESGPAGSFTYHYDPNGVRLSDTKNTYTYSTTSNRLVSRNGTTVVSDAAGNITNDGLGHTYVYNQAGHLAQVLQGNTLIATYTYDYRGFRTRKVTTAAAPQGALVVRYVYDESGHLVAEVGATGAAIRSYIWADDKLYAQIDHTPTWKEIYFEVDHLGTPRAALDQSGNVVWTWESDAFGAIQPNQNPTGAGVEIVNLRFPGQYYDQETGLYYNMHRYYDPSMGQYTQSDPIGLAGGSFSTYTYVGGNPLVWSDSSGLFRCLPGIDCSFTPQTQDALQCFDSCTGRETVVTGGRGNRSNPNSSHSRGEACDVGRNANSDLTRDSAQQCTVQCFPRGYGQEEQNRDGGTHFHLQLNTVPGAVPGFSPTIKPYQP